MTVRFGLGYASCILNCQVFKDLAESPNVEKPHFPPTLPSVESISPAALGSLSEREILTLVHDAEARFALNPHIDPDDDHRQHLTRNELENVLMLIQRRIRKRSSYLVRD